MEEGQIVHQTVHQTVKTYQPDAFSWCIQGRL